MKIAGIEKCSFVDYPGHLAAVMFTSGCNWNCFYCHNRSIIGEENPAPVLNAAGALAWLKTRRGFLDAVVVTGGEPTLQPDLIDFLRMLRSTGLLIKLDTNGTHPDVLAAILEEGLVDYVAMDLKAPAEKYESFCGAAVNQRALDRSISLIMESGVDYEFRTTVAPQLTEDDVLAIARRICGARRYVLQQYQRPVGEASDPRLDEPRHEPTWPSRIYDVLEGLVQQCETRGFEKPRAVELNAA